MKTAKTRRERLFRNSRPNIRPVVYEDIRWLWTAAKRAGTYDTVEEFTQQVEPYLAGADKLFMLSDKNKEFSGVNLPGITDGTGPVGIVLANYDGWSLVPHVHWFPWATPRNILRCTVGFLQSMKYTHGVGSIKIFATAENAEWFKWLKRYVAISLAGRIPYGRAEGEETIFYLRGRKQSERRNQDHIRWRRGAVKDQPANHPATASSNTHT